jgi:hypothetical protein
MRNRERHRTQHLGSMRLTISCLPVHTREAMLEGVLSSDRIIVGAYVDREGGVCPMLAAHRRGGRTDFLAFAKAWDRFTGARRPRPASRRELSVLISLLEESLGAETGLDLAGAIAEHRMLSRRSAEDRTRRIRGLSGVGEVRVRRLRGRRAAGALSVTRA